jgi:hypothetical protein
VQVENVGAESRKRGVCSLKAWQLKRRVDGLSKELSDPGSGGIVHLDFESFPEAEKLLFHKVGEIEAEFLRTGSTENLEKRMELILKEFEVVLRRVTELYCFAVPICLGSVVDREIAEYFFKLHFYNFEADLSECLEHVRTWSDEDRAEFVADLKKNGSMLFRIPRGFGEDDTDLVDMRPSENDVQDSNVESLLACGEEEQKPDANGAKSETLPDPGRG